MGYVTSVSARPIQGVSQQPEKTRNDGQCSVQDNMSASVVYGLKKKTGSFHIAKILDSLGDNAKVHHYRRGDGEEYFIILEESNGTPRVFSVDGVEQTVVVASGEAYCTDSNPTSNFDMQTISDYTFIVNKTVPVELRSEQSPSIANSAIVYVQFATYGRKYRVFIDGVGVAYWKSPDGSSSSHTDDVDTSNVATELYNDLVLLPELNVTRDRNNIYISRVDGGDFSITTEDGSNGDDVIAVKGRVEELSDLPPRAPEGFTVEISPPGDDSSSYWLTAVGNDGDSVTWTETIAPETKYGYDKGTMPVTLVRTSITNGLATFTLSEGDWKDRASGDDETVPYSGFIYEESPVPIEGIGIFQNRLYLLSGESLCLSEGDGNFFNFFKPSAAVSVDTDPIDVYTDSAQISTLQHGAVLDGDLAIFSSNGQYILSGEKPVTRENATLRNATTFECNVKVKPVAAGDNIFFAYDFGEYTGVREFFTDSITDTKKANPITEHIPSYILGSARALETSTNQNWLFVLSNSVRNVMYVYQWLWLGAEKVQSAWHRWVWPDDEEVIRVVFSKDKLYMLIRRPEGVFLESLMIGDPSDTGTISTNVPLGFPIRLDRKHTVTATFNNNRWEFPDMLPDEDLENLIAVRASGCYDEDIGATVIFEREGSIFISYDDLSDSGTCELIIGKSFKAVYEPTLPVVKDFKNRVLGVDKLTVSRMHLNYEDSGYVKVTVTDRWRKSREYEFSGRVLGEYNNIVGFAPLREGTHTFPVHQKADSVTVNISSDSYLPLQIRDLEWSGHFHQRSRRV